MFRTKAVINNDRHNDVNVRMTQADLDEFKEVLISVNPFYDWLEENIDIVSYKLLKGFITNIVPLGDAGKKYFKKIAQKKLDSLLSYGNYIISWKKCIGRVFYKECPT